MALVTVFRHVPRPITGTIGVVPGADEDQARRLLTRAEAACLVTGSLGVRPHLESVVEVEGL